MSKPRRGGLAAAQRKAREFLAHCEFWSLDPAEVLAPIMPPPAPGRFDFAGWLHRLGGIAPAEAALILGVTEADCRRYASPIGGPIPAAVARACAEIEGQTQNGAP